MKKMVLVFAASVITLFAAQSVKAQNFTFGVKGGKYWVMNIMRS